MTFGGREVLHIDYLRLEEGRTYSLQGPNGVENHAPRSSGLVERTACREYMFSGAACRLGGTCVASAAARGGAGGTASDHVQQFWCVKMNRLRSGHSGDQRLRTQASRRGSNGSHGYWPSG